MTAMGRKRSRRSPHSPSPQPSPTTQRGPPPPCHSVPRRRGPRPPPRRRPATPAPAPTKIIPLTPHFIHLSARDPQPWLNERRTPSDCSLPPAAAAAVRAADACALSQCSSAESCALRAQSGIPLAARTPSLFPHVPLLPPSPLEYPYWVGYPHWVPAYPQTPISYSNSLRRTPSIQALRLPVTRTPPTPAVATRAFVYQQRPSPLYIYKCPIFPNRPTGSNRSIFHPSSSPVTHSSPSTSSPFISRSVCNFSSPTPPPSPSESSTSLVQCFPLNKSSTSSRPSSSGNSAKSAPGKLSDSVTNLIHGDRPTVPVYFGSSRRPRCVEKFTQCSLIASPNRTSSVDSANIFFQGAPSFPSLHSSVTCASGRQQVASRGPFPCRQRPTLTPPFATHENLDIGDPWDRRTMRNNRRSGANENDERESMMGESATGTNSTRHTTRPPTISDIGSKGGKRGSCICGYSSGMWKNLEKKTADVCIPACCLRGGQYHKETDMYRMNGLQDDSEFERGPFPRNREMCCAFSCPQFDGGSQNNGWENQPTCMRRNGLDPEDQAPCRMATNFNGNTDNSPQNKTVNGGAWDGWLGQPSSCPNLQSCVPGHNPLHPCCSDPLLPYQQGRWENDHSTGIPTDRGAPRGPSVLWHPKEAVSLCRRCACTAAMDREGYWNAVAHVHGVAPITGQRDTMVPCNDASDCVSPEKLLVGGTLHKEVDTFRNNGLQDNCHFCVPHLRGGFLDHIPSNPELVMPMSVPSPFLMGGPMVQSCLSPVRTPCSGGTESPPGSPPGSRPGGVDNFPLPCPECLKRIARFRRFYKAPHWEKAPAPWPWWAAPKQQQQQMQETKQAQQPQQMQQTKQQPRSKAMKGDNVPCFWSSSWPYGTVWPPSAPSDSGPQWLPCSSSWEFGQNFDLGGSKSGSMGRASALGATLYSPREISKRRSTRTPLSPSTNHSPRSPGTSSSPGSSPNGSPCLGGNPCMASAWNRPNVQQNAFRPWTYPQCMLVGSPVPFSGPSRPTPTPSPSSESYSSPWTSQSNVCVNQEQGQGVVRCDDGPLRPVKQRSPFCLAGHR